MPASLVHIHTPGPNSGVCVFAIRQNSFASFRKPLTGPARSGRPDDRLSVSVTPVLGVMDSGLAPLVRPGMTG
jgi:hypothetical protein